MLSAKIQCPRCHGRFVLKTQSVDKLANKAFKCPKCGQMTPFAQMLRTVPPVPHTHIAAASRKAPMPGGKTLVDLSAKKVISLEVKETGKTFTLGSGTYTLGRDSIDSRASLRIAPDPHISRFQATLDVSPRGCILTDLNDTNPIMVNGKPMKAGQTMTLRDGDQLFIGVTNMKVKLL